MHRFLTKTAIVAAIAMAGLTSLPADAGNANTTLTRAPSSTMMLAGRTLRRSDDLSIVATPNVAGALKPMKLHFNCIVQGNPVEFPNDIMISHNYNFTTAAGIAVAWTAPFGKTGVAILPALAPGKVYYVSNAIPGGMEAGMPCAASQM